MEHYIRPISILQYNIYDVFYNDAGSIVLILPSEVSPPPKIQLQGADTLLDFTVYTCPHNHTYIYTCETAFSEHIELRIQGVCVSTSVHRYPEMPNTIIMSTIVKNEDAYIRQWIRYHQSLGVSAFVIYDNSNTGTLGTLLADFVHEGLVILIHWPFAYQLKRSGISGQTTQQNHSIYAFQTCSYIGLFDIDEYVNPQTTACSLDTFFATLLSEKQIDRTKISGFQVRNKFFYNPQNLPTNDYEFLRIVNSTHITKGGREKNFVIPKHVRTFSVHMVTDGLPIYRVDESLLYFNHYYFLNKQSRGRQQTNIVDDTILSNARPFLEHER